MRWVSEQQAARLDHLVRLLGRSERTGQRLIGRLNAAGWIEAKRVFVDEPVWVWLTSLGQEVAGTGFRPWRFAVGRLAHVAAVNEVRLHIAERLPQATWVCERALARDRRDSQEHTPDAVLRHGEEQHAIEVELTPKARRRLEAILDELDRRFERVAYFCGPETLAQLGELSATGRWPGLVVRALPERSGGEASAT